MVLMMMEMVLSMIQEGGILSTTIMTLQTAMAMEHTVQEL